MLPVRLVGREHLADRLVAAPVAAEALERGRDRLLALRRAEALGELESEVGRALADVALGHAQQQDVLRAERAHRERGADARVDAAGDAQHGAAAAELAHGVADARGEGVGRGLEVEGERVCRGGCGHACHPTRAKVPRGTLRPGRRSGRTPIRSDRCARPSCGRRPRPAAGFASLASKRQRDGIPPQDRDGAASARPQLSPCPQAGCPGTPRARSASHCSRRTSTAISRVSPCARWPRSRRSSLWAGAGGGSLGGALRSGLELIAGRAVALAPLALAALGASLLVRADARRLRPVPRRRRPAPARRCSRCSARRGLDDDSLRTGGGYPGNGMHAAVAAVAGEPGALVLAVFALVAGLLLLSGASAHVLLGNSATAARSSAQGVVRVAATVRSVPLPADFPAAVRPRRTRTTASAPPLDVEQRFPDVFEPEPEPEPTFEPAADRHAARCPRRSRPRTPTAT